MSVDFTHRSIQHSSAVFDQAAELSEKLPTLSSTQMRHITNTLSDLGRENANLEQGITQKIDLTKKQIKQLHLRPFQAKARTQLKMELAQLEVSLKIVQEAKKMLTVELPATIDLAQRNNDEAMIQRLVHATQTAVVDVRHLDSPDPKERALIQHYRQLLSNCKGSVSEAQQQAIIKVCLARVHAAQMGQSEGSYKIGAHTFHLAPATRLGIGGEAEVFNAGNHIAVRVALNNTSVGLSQTERAIIEKLSDPEVSRLPGSEHVVRFFGVTNTADGKQGLAMECVSGGDMTSRTEMIQFATALGLQEDQIPSFESRKSCFEGKEKEIQEFSQRSGIAPQELMARFLTFQPKSKSEREAMAQQVKNGMKFLLNQGIFHNDLSAGNVLIADQGIKITDFGKAQFRKDVHAIAQQASQFTCIRPKDARDFRVVLQSMPSDDSSTMTQRQFLNALCEKGALEMKDGAYYFKDMKQFKAVCSEFAISSQVKDSLIKQMNFLHNPLPEGVTQEYFSRLDQNLLEAYARSGNPDQCMDLMNRMQHKMAARLTFKLLTGELPPGPDRMTAQNRQDARRALLQVVDASVADEIMADLANIEIDADEAFALASTLGLREGDDPYEHLGLVKPDKVKLAELGVKNPLLLIAELERVEVSRVSNLNSSIVSVNTRLFGEGSARMIRKKEVSADDMNVQSRNFQLLAVKYTLYPQDVNTTEVMRLSQIFDEMLAQYRMVATQDAYSSCSDSDLNLIKQKIALLIDQFNQIDQKSFTTAELKFAAGSLKVALDMLKTALEAA